MDEEKTQEFKHIHQFIVRATVFWDEPDHVEGTWMCADTYLFFFSYIFSKKIQSILLSSHQFRISPGEEKAEARRQWRTSG